ncbi:unnamed protein product [Didymodactylos carnosus]|uniref:Uncharacterized protein n=1 Tax=Didymodactylos carnosus TaxID=1234261 RepID=A0A8S2GUE3_9BILA|nr:unnamed protein product [Didymodactylos carnosus]CAF3560023.1 unnamed protein product [Didymodactylos carnosus]
MDVNGNCSCKTHPTTCGEQSGIIDTDSEHMYVIPGFRTGCLTVVTLFTSTLECYFDQSCLDTIYTLIYSTSFFPFNATAMNYSSSASRYNTTTKIQEIIEQLMIEQWNNVTSFDSYFSECNPDSCTYIYNKQADWIYVITTIVGLVGGLTTVLRILIPPLVAFIRRKKRLVTELDSYAELLGNAPRFRTKVDDFRHIAGLFFQMLYSFCQLSLQTIDTALVTFNSTAFITPNLVPLAQFQVQTNQFVNQFTQNTARSFASTLSLINNMTQANMLVSGLLTDSISTIYPQYYYLDYEYVYDRRDQEYNSTGIECDCEETPYCIQQAVVYDSNSGKNILFHTPGIYVGCYIVEALLQSDLQCFFDFDCLQSLLNALSSAYSNVSAIVLPNSTHYAADTPMQVIVQNLMVEEWNNDTSYDSYFNICRPDHCTAMYVSRGNVVYIITTTIGLIGGLTKVMHRYGQTPLKLPFIPPSMIEQLLQVYHDSPISGHLGVNKT